MKELTDPLNGAQSKLKPKVDKGRPILSWGNHCLPSTVPRSGDASLLAPAVFSPPFADCWGNNDKENRQQTNLLRTCGATHFSIYFIKIKELN
jgi:hypothetical protein